MKTEEVEERRERKLQVALDINKRPVNSAWEQKRQVNRGIERTWRGDPWTAGANRLAGANRIELSTWRCMKSLSKKWSSNCMQYMLLFPEYFTVILVPWIIGLYYRLRNVPSSKEVPGGLFLYEIVLCFIFTYSNSFRYVRQLIPCPFFVQLWPIGTCSLFIDTLA